MPGEPVAELWVPNIVPYDCKPDDADNYRSHPKHSFDWLNHMEKHPEESKRAADRHQAAEC